MTAVPLNRSTYELLYDAATFYHQPDYHEVTVQEFTQAPPTTYRWESTYKIIRIAKLILAIVIFPIGIYQLIHALIGKLVVPASFEPKEDSDEYRLGIALKDAWKYKRISMEVDGNHIDAMIMGTETSLKEKKWVLFSNGNGARYETAASYDTRLKTVLETLNVNVLSFNYPGVGRSEGWPTRSAMTNTYRAMLDFLAEHMKATTIIGWGCSLGGGVQSDALKNYRLRTDIQYAFVKDRTFSSISALLSTAAHPMLSCCVKFFGWNLSSVESSRQLTVPEIILQTAARVDIGDYGILNDFTDVVNDGVIPAEASLARALLQKDYVANKLFLGMCEGHNRSIINPLGLAQRINTFLFREH